MMAVIGQDVLARSQELLLIEKSPVVNLEKKDSLKDRFGGSVHAIEKEHKPLPKSFRHTLNETFSDGKEVTHKEDLTAQESTGQQTNFEITSAPHIFKDKTFTAPNLDDEFVDFTKLILKGDKLQEENDANAIISPLNITRSKEKMKTLEIESIQPITVELQVLKEFSPIQNEIIAATDSASLHSSIEKTHPSTNGFAVNASEQNETVKSLVILESEQQKVLDQQVMSTQQSSLQHSIETSAQPLSQSIISGNLSLLQEKSSPAKNVGAKSSINEIAAAPTQDINNEKIPDVKNIDSRANISKEKLPLATSESENDAEAGQEVFIKSTPDQKTKSAPIFTEGENNENFEVSDTTKTTTSFVVQPQKATSPIETKTFELSQIDQQKLMDHIAEQFEGRVRAKDSTFEIQLNPEGLGHIHIELSFEDKTVKATFKARENEALQFLQNNAARIAEVFETQGFTSDQNSLSFSMQDSPNQNAKQAYFTENSSSTTAKNSENLTASYPQPIKSISINQNGTFAITA